MQVTIERAARHYMAATPGEGASYQSSPTEDIGIGKQ